jgi:hypothetical protein
MLLICNSIYQDKIMRFFIFFNINTLIKNAKSEKSEWHSPEKLCNRRFEQKVYHTKKRLYGK